VYLCENRSVSATGIEIVRCCICRWCCGTYISWSVGSHECPGRPYECEIHGFAGSVNFQIMAVLVPTIVVVSDGFTCVTSDYLVCGELLLFLYVCCVGVICT
jgi:hypothetical protein